MLLFTVFLNDLFMILFLKYGVDSRFDGKLPNYVKIIDDTYKTIISCSSLINMGKILSI